MSHFEGDADTKLCTGKGMTCAYSAITKYRQRRQLNDTYAADFRDNCNCLSSCSYIRYLADVSTLKFVYEKGDQRSDALTSLSILFKGTQFMPLKRSEKYDLVYMYSTFGGLLSLFLGISLLSLLELVFYCTIPIIYKILNRTEKKLPAPESFLKAQSKWRFIEILPPLD